MSDGNRRQIVVVAERMFAVDPTAVWSLLANPERVEEWGGVVLVGYMGTELPKAGQNVFVRSARWSKLAKTRRVEIEAWDAGSSVKCLVHSDDSTGSFGFELMIRPEVDHEGIRTTVRLVQRMETSVAMSALTNWWVGMQLRRRLDRIDMVLHG